MFIAWSQKDPPDEWERERNERIKAGQGNGNPYVENFAIDDARPPELPTLSAEPIIGNRRSKIYHLPGCPSYGRVSEGNRVEFMSREEADSEGYRLAGNCH